MGCDIHPYIEVKSPYGDRYDPWCYGQIYFRRHYVVFALMASVRNYDNWKPVAEPKGFPKDASWHVDHKFHMYIDDDIARVQDACNCDHEYHYCTEAEAERYASHGCCITTDFIGRRKIDDPDHHTPSWMTVEELEEVQRRLREMGYPDRDLEVIIATMKALDSDTPGRSRLVFWFDN